MLAPWALPLANPAQAQVRDINDAINKAGRQRMLSQRVAKAYLALAQSVRRDQAERVMADSMALFDRQLVELKVFAPSSEVRQTYERLESAWAAYKAELVGLAPSRNGAAAIWQSATQVLELAHQGTVQLESHSGKALGKLVNLCGRQRMLSQRMAAMYLSASWGVQGDASLKVLRASREEFVQALGVLKGAPETTAPIQAELALADQQWTFFDAALGTLRVGATDTRAQSEVFTSSERILQVMDAVTGLYAKLA